MAEESLKMGLKSRRKNILIIEKRKCCLLKPVTDKVKHKQPHRKENTKAEFFFLGS